MRQVITKEMVLIAAKEAVTDLGFHHIGPKGYGCTVDGRRCLSFEAVHRLGAPITGPMSGAQETLEVHVNQYGATFEPAAKSLLAQLISLNDAGTEWGRAFEAVV